MFCIQERFERADAESKALENANKELEININNTRKVVDQVCRVGSSSVSRLVRQERRCDSVRARGRACVMGER